MLYFWETGAVIDEIGHPRSTFWQKHFPRFYQGRHDAGAGDLVLDGQKRDDRKGGFTLQVLDYGRARAGVFNRFNLSGSCRCFHLDAGFQLRVFDAALVKHLVHVVPVFALMNQASASEIVFLAGLYGGVPPTARPDHGRERGRLIELPPIRVKVPAV